MKVDLIAVDYYERTRVRLVRKDDLSGELTIIAKVGPAGTMTVVKEPMADHKGLVAGAWEMSQRLQDIGKHRISLIVNEREHSPRADVSYQFINKADTAKVHITTAGETFKLETNAGKRPMTAQMTCIELGKYLTFIALTG